MVSWRICPPFEVHLLLTAQVQTSPDCNHDAPPLLGARRAVFLLQAAFVWMNLQNRPLPSVEEGQGGSAAYKQTGCSFLRTVTPTMALRTSRVAAGLLVAGILLVVFGLVLLLGGRAVMNDQITKVSSDVSQILIRLYVARSQNGSALNLTEVGKIHNNVY